MDARTLYNEMAGEAWKLAAKSMLDIEDIQQELFLMCMEVAEGRSAYTPMIGGVHAYIMGRLWGLLHRWQRSQSFEDLVHPEDSEMNVYEQDFFIPAVLHTPSVEDALEQRDVLYEQDVIDIEENRLMCERTKDQSTLFILIKTGHWSARNAAKYCGVSRNAIEKRIAKARELTTPP